MIVLLLIVDAGLLAGAVWYLRRLIVALENRPAGVPVMMPQPPTGRTVELSPHAAWYAAQQQQYATVPPADQIVQSAPQQPWPGFQRPEDRS